MYFANPWGLLALLALPVIVVIHLYHRRFPPLLVAGLHLWGAETQTRTAGRRRDRLPITTSLLLELLAALLLALVLSQPRFGAAQSVTHLVVVLDNSAAMSAAPAGEPSFREAALDELERRIQRLQRGSVVTLIVTGRRPALLAGPAVPWSQAKLLLDGWQPRAPLHDFQPAWDLAAQLAEDGGQLLFLTSRLPAPDVVAPGAMEIVSVGRSLDNVAITAARWSLDSETNRGLIYLRISNLGRQTAEVIVQARAGEHTLFGRTATIPAGGELPLEQPVPGGLGEMTVEIAAPGDGLAIDDSVTLIEPQVRLLTVALTLPEDEPAHRLVRRVLELLPDVQFGEPQSAHLTIGRGDALPPSRRDSWWLGVGPLDREESARRAARDIAGPYLIERRNPLLDGVQLSGVVWGGVQALDLDVTPLVSAGRTPLLARLNGTRTTAYLLNIDLGRSNLADSPDWPVLLTNLVGIRRDNLPGLRRWSYRLNEDIRFRLFEGDAMEAAGRDLVLVHANKTRPLARTPIVELPPLDEPGVYEIRDGDQAIGRFAVNFHDVEGSNLLSLQAGTRPPTAPPASGRFELDRAYSWIVLLGLVLIMAVVVCDWAVLKTRGGKA